MCKSCIHYFPALSFHKYFNTHKLASREMSTTKSAQSAASSAKTQTRVARLEELALSMRQDMAELKRLVSSLAKPPSPIPLVRKKRTQLDEVDEDDNEDKSESDKEDSTLSSGQQRGPEVSTVSTTVSSRSAKSRQRPETVGDAIGQDKDLRDAVVALRTRGLKFDPPSQVTAFLSAMKKIVHDVCATMRNGTTPDNGEVFDADFVRRMVAPNKIHALVGMIRAGTLHASLPADPEFTREDLTFPVFYRCLNTSLRPHRTRTDPTGAARYAASLRARLASLKLDISSPPPLLLSEFVEAVIKFLVDNGLFEEGLEMDGDGHETMLGQDTNGTKGEFFSEQQLRGILQQEQTFQGNDRVLTKALLTEIRDALPAPYKEEISDVKYEVGFEFNSTENCVVRFLNRIQGRLFVKSMVELMAQASRVPSGIAASLAGAAGSSIKRHKRSGSGGSKQREDSSGARDAPPGEKGKPDGADGPKLKLAISEIQCFRCGQLGHTKRNCPLPKEDSDTGGGGAGATPSGSAPRIKNPSTGGNSSGSSGKASSSKQQGSSKGKEKTQGKSKQSAESNGNLVSSRGGSGSGMKVDRIEKGVRFKDDDGRLRTPLGDVITADFENHVLSVLLDPGFHRPKLSTFHMDRVLCAQVGDMGIAHQPNAIWESLDARAHLALDVPHGVFSVPVLLDSGSPDDFVSTSYLDLLKERGVTIKRKGSGRVRDGVKFKAINGAEFVPTDRARIKGTLSFGGVSKEIVLHAYVIDAGEHLPLVMGRASMKRVGFALVWVDDEKSPVTVDEFESIPEDFVCSAIALGDGKVEEDFPAERAIMNRIAERTLRDNVVPSEDELEQFRSAVRRMQQKQTDMALAEQRETIKSSPFMSPDQRLRALRMLKQYKDAFTLGYREEPMTLTPETPTEVQPGARPRPPPNRHPSSLRQALGAWAMIIMLLAFKVISKHADFVMAGACNTFLTNGRMVVDTSLQKDLVRRTPDKAVTVDSQIKTLAGTNPRNKFFLSYDLSKIFHHVAYNPQSPDVTRLMTFQGKTYKYDRLIMGGVSSMFHLNEVLDVAFADLEGHARYADDGRIGASTVNGLLDRAEKFLRRCIEFNIPVNPKKFVLIATETYWCGYNVSADGHVPDPRSADIVRQMPTPTNGEDLIKVLGIVRWVSAAIPDCARLIDPLQEVLSKVQDAAREKFKTTSPKSSQLRHFSLSEKRFGWNESHNAAWKATLAALANRLLLRHRDLDKALVLVTDASHTGWAGILGQVPKSDIGKPILRMKFEPLGCMGGNFAGAQLNWPTIEKEAYAIKRTVERLWHAIDDGTSLHIFTDHRNLESVFDPAGAYLSSKAIPSRDRLIRWASLLQRLASYSITHIDGDDNVFADFVSRIKSISQDHVKDAEDFGPSFPQALVSELPTKEGCVDPAVWQRADGTADAVAFATAFGSVSSPDWVQPSITDIHKIAGHDGVKQREFQMLAQHLSAEFDKDLMVWRVNGRVLIPDSDIRLKLMIMAHCGASGHRGRDATANQLKAFVFWPGLDKDVADFVGNCAYCKAHYSDNVKRPYGRALTAHARNQVLTMDFLHLALSPDAEASKVLVLMDRLSGFTRLYPASSENAVAVDEAVMDWVSSYGVPSTIASDQGPAFTAERVSALLDSLGVDHHVVSAGVHFPHGRIERLNRDLLRVFRRLLTENRMDESLWPRFIPIVQMVINHTPVKSLSGFAPVTLFMGLEPTQPIMAFFNEDTKKVVEVRRDSDLPSFAQQLREACKAREVRAYEAQEQAHLQRAAKRARTPGVQHTVFHVGDWVMVRSTKRGNKLTPKWVGPAKVTEILDNGFRVKVELTDASSRPSGYHVSEVQFFDYGEQALSRSAKAYRDYLAQREHVLAQVLEFRYLSAHKLWQVLVEWGTRDVTWEPLATIDRTASEAVDRLVELYEHRGQSATASEVRAFLETARKGKRRSYGTGGTVTD